MINFCGIVDYHSEFCSTQKLRYITIENPYLFAFMDHNTPHSHADTICDPLWINHPFAAFVKTEINTPSENTFVADQNGTFIFSIGLSCAKL